MKQIIFDIWALRLEQRALTETQTLFSGSRKSEREIRSICQEQIDEDQRQIDCTVAALRQHLSGAALEVATLKAERFTFEEISEKVGYCDRQCRRIFKAAIEKIEKHEKVLFL